MGNKPAWLFRQSAVIPFTEDNGVVKIVLVSSRSKNGWVIPKGVVERFMTPEDSAAKEALEEAGVIGNVSSEELIEYTYEKWGGTCTVKVYPLCVTQVLDSWDEQSTRDRVIVELPEAIELVKPELKHVVPEISKFIKKE